MRLCQTHCQENKRKVPESPLLTARRGGLTVYATPWSQKRGRRFGSLAFFQQYCSPVFGAGFREQTGAAGRSWWPGFRPFAGASHPSAMQAAMDTHTHPYNTVKLGWGFVKPIARKTNERFRSLRYSLHAEGAWRCMQHPGPRNGAAVLEALPSSICWRQPSFCIASRHGHTHIHIILISLHIIVEVFIYCIQLSNIYERFRDPRSIERRNVENGLHG